MHIILPAHVGLIMRIQAYSCVRKPLPKNPNFFISFFFCLYFHMFVLFSFFFHVFMPLKSMFHMFNLPSLSHMLELGFIICLIPLML